MKRLLVFLGSLPGIGLLLFTVVSKQLIDIQNIEEIKELMGYMENSGNKVMSEDSLLGVAVLATEYYQWIIIGCILWIFTFAILWHKTGGKKNVKK